MLCDPTVVGDRSNMAATTEAMTFPTDPQHSRSLSIFLYQIDSLATQAAARGQYVLKASIKVVHKTASVILSIPTGPDGSSQELRRARTV